MIIEGILELILAILIIAIPGILLINVMVDHFQEKKGGVKVLKRGRKPTKKVECQHCHSIIRYSRANMYFSRFTYDDHWEILCPVCGLAIKVEDWEGGEL